MLSNLEDSIQELLSQEPYWSCCFPCRNHGNCCIGADVSVSENEWAMIKQFVARLPDHEQDLLSKNIESGNSCIFRIDTKCLIHEVRPENCRYTPFQAVITQGGELLYSMVSEDCNFKSIRQQLDYQAACEIANTRFPTLQNFNITTKYLCLNQIFNPSQCKEDVRLVSEWLHLSPFPVRKPSLDSKIAAAEAKKMQKSSNTTPTSANDDDIPGNGAPNLERRSHSRDDYER